MRFRVRRSACSPHVSLCADHQTTAINPRLIKGLNVANGPSISTNRHMASPVTTASGNANKEAYCVPSSIDIRPINTAAITNMAKMKCSRVSK